MSLLTIRDIAKFCGLSPSGVSAALRNKKNISAETKKKVREAATHLGYANDARLSQLMSYLRLGKGSRNAPSLVLLYATETEDALDTKPWLIPYAQGVASRCQNLGYFLDRMWIDSKDINSKRINSVLYARGVEGLILFHPTDDLLSKLNLRWDRFAVSAIEGDHAGRSFPRVAAMGYENSLMAMDQLRTLGYKRPGLVLGKWINDYNDGHWRAGFIESQWELPANCRIPPLVEEAWARLLPKWVEKYKPDVIICAESRVRKCLEENSIQVPNKIALIHLNLGADVPYWAGVDNLHSELASAAVDVVVANSQRGETGIPLHPQSIFMRGIWRHGSTCPPRKGRKKNSAIK